MRLRTSHSADIIHERTHAQSIRVFCCRPAALGVFFLPLVLRMRGGVRALGRRCAWTRRANRPLVWPVQVVHISPRCQRVEKPPLWPLHGWAGGVGFLMSHGLTERYIVLRHLYNSVELGSIVEQVRRDREVNEAVVGQSKEPQHGADQKVGVTEQVAVVIHELWTNEEFLVVRAVFEQLLSLPPRDERVQHTVNDQGWNTHILHPHSVAEAVSDEHPRQDAHVVAHCVHEAQERSDQYDSVAKKIARESRCQRTAKAATHDDDVFRWPAKDVRAELKSSNRDSPQRLLGTFARTDAVPGVLDEQHVNFQNAAEAAPEGVAQPQIFSVGV
mmetsp:Transcript_54910/g.146625  ORF Transcript_54910/g.146625 Transcript_54910/m.146625 type:complete len:330 (-) Transcript_54910:244-1233(-)